jgi:hypothetical protein
VLCLRLAAEQVTEKSAKGGTAPSNPPPDMFLKIHMQHQACYPLTDAKKKSLKMLRNLRTFEEQRRHESSPFPGLT